MQRPSPTLPELRSLILRLNQQIHKNDERLDDLERSPSAVCTETREYARDAIAHANNVNRATICELQGAMWEITESWRTSTISTISSVSSVSSASSSPSRRYSTSDAGLSDAASDESETSEEGDAKACKHVRWADRVETTI